MKFGFIAGFATAAGLAALAAVAAPFSSTVQQASYVTATYTVAAGKTSTGILLPVENRPIHLMVACTTNGDRGMGSVTIMREVGGANNVLSWVGEDLHSNIGGDATIAQGLNIARNTHILYADYNGQVDVQLNTADTIHIANKTNAAETVVVTMMY